MPLFARLFGKTPPSPPTLQERVSILHAGSADVILDAALHAGDESLRIAAIDKLPDGDDLRKLAGLSATAESTVASPATLQRAAQTLRHLDWFEVTQIRGQIEDDRVAHFQIGLKVGFRLEDS